MEGGKPAVSSLVTRGFSGRMCPFLSCPCAAGTVMSLQPLARASLKVVPAAFQPRPVALARFHCGDLVSSPLSSSGW